ncbi:MAG: hypothetical protein ABIL44_00960 [candidate division WOR-3 bacterium]
MNIKIDKISIYGSEKEIEIAQTILKQFLSSELFKEDESKARIEIQRLIDKHNIKATILWDGNIVWSKKRILKDIRKIVDEGMNAMSDYLYQFLNLCCGSIAHYDKWGWISKYPYLEALRKFFIKNEFGQSVLSYQPWWATDRIEIVKEIYKFFGLRSEYERFD